MRSRSRRWFITLTFTFALALGLGSAMVLLWSLADGSSARAAPADELHVCPGGCTYSSVQAAVDAAEPGDVIKVAEGTYNDVHVRDSITQVVYVSKTVTIQGGYTTADWTTPDPDSNVTTLDAQGQGRVFYVTGDIAFTVEGLQITGGDATGLGGTWTTDSGGGVFVYRATVTISNCSIISNTASTASSGYGGGLDLEEGNAILSNNIICGNSAAFGSGGRGGGMYVYDSNIMLEGNTICGNSASAQGGGVCIYWGDATLSRNEVYSNSTIGTGSGGGLYAAYVNALLGGNTITGNTSAFFGGGLYVTSVDSFVLTNNLVADNYAGELGSGLYVEAAAPRLVHNTIARNSGGDGTGILVNRNFYGEPSNVVMTNTVIVSHAVGISVWTGNTATLEATLWYANPTPWEGNVLHKRDYNDDPAFGPDGYHLTDGSAAIDRGVETTVIVDIDGDARPQGGGPDIGADEFPLPPSDVLWEKQIRINDGALQPWDSGPFTVVPGDTATIVDRVWVTGTANASLDLSEAWTPSLEWVGYQASVGSVTASALAATWSVVDAAPNSWHELTKTLRVLENPDYADTISETLSVTGATYKPPARVIPFQHRRPEPTWEKAVQINDSEPQAWSARGFVVAPGDAVTVTDRVWIDHWGDVTFSLAQRWGDGLDLVRWTSSAGAVTAGTGTLSWEAAQEAADQWHTLTAAFRVVGTVGLRESLTETLTVEDTDSQLAQRVVKLLVSATSPDCHARVNDNPTTYPTVQSAVDAARAGDLVKVAGHCTALNLHGGLVQVVYLDKSLSLRGGYTTTNWIAPDPSANPTTLDAGGHGRVMVITGTIAPTVEGLRITGGNANGLGGSPWGEDAGGGVYVLGATAVIKGNLIYGNSTDEIGGGLYLHESSSQLTHNTISGNTAPNGGGGLYLSHSGATLTGNSITGNAATPFGHGGGVFFRDSDDASLSGNAFSGNTAGNNGGGLSLHDSDAALNGNTISDNNAGSDGGGLELYFSDASLTGNVVTGNTAFAWGGGIHLYGGAPTLVNTVVADNMVTQGAVGRGAGIHVRYCSPHLLHSTVARNSGGDGSGIYVTDAGFGSWPSSLAMTNTIIVSQAVGITVTTDNTATLHSTLWHANGADWGGAGTINRADGHAGDPTFLSDGYHLSGNSAAIDAAVNAGVSTDVDGDPRPQGSGYDVGADEYMGRIYLPLVMRRRSPDQ